MLQSCVIDLRQDYWEPKPVSSNLEDSDGRGTSPDTEQWALEYLALTTRERQDLTSMDESFERTSFIGHCIFSPGVAIAPESSSLGLSLEISPLAAFP